MKTDILDYPRKRNERYFFAKVCHCDLVLSLAVIWRGKVP